MNLLTAPIYCEECELESCRVCGRCPQCDGCDELWCNWCDRPQSDCACHLDPNGIPEGHWSKK